MKILVTGGTGFLGSHFVEALLAEGAEVFALLRDPKKPGWLSGSAAHVLKGDLFSIPSLPRDLDAVYHLAGIAKSNQTAVYYTVNHFGTASLLAALARQGLKPYFVFVSTISAGGPSPEGRLRREDDPPRPVSPYGRSKRLAEEEVLRCKDAFPVTILRPGVIFGPRDKDFLSYIKIIDRGLMPMLRSVPLQVSGISIKDAVRAMLLLLRLPPRSGEIYNLAASPPLEMEEFSRTAASLLGRKLKPFRLSRRAAHWLSWAAGLASGVAGVRPSLNKNFYMEMIHGNWAVDVQKAAEDLSFRADTPLEAALAETLAWYKDMGWLRTGR